MSTVRYLPLLCNELTEDLIQKAALELNETAEKAQQGIRTLRSLIAKENLQVPTEDSFLVAFLRVRKFRIDKAQETLRRYAVLRSKYVKYFAYHDFSAIRKFGDLKICGFLPYRDEEGAAIVYMRETPMSLERLNLEEGFNYLLPLLLFMLEYPPSSIAGFKVILDFPMKGLLNYFAYLKGALLYFQVIASALPIRLKRVDIVNENPISRAIVNIVWPFAPVKLQQRAQLHGKNMKSLAKCYNPSILPEEFAGTLGPIHNEFFFNEFRIFYQRMRMQNPLVDNQNSLSNRRCKISKTETEASKGNVPSRGRKN